MLATLVVHGCQADAASSADAGDVHVAVEGELALECFDVEFRPVVFDMDDDEIEHGLRDASVDSGLQQAGTPVAVDTDPL